MFYYLCFDCLREEFEEMFVKKWIQDEFSHGAFVYQEPYQKYTYMVNITIIIITIILI